MVRVVEQNIIITRDVLTAVFHVCEKSGSLNKDVVHAFILLIQNEIYAEEVILLLNTHQYRNSLLQVIQHLLNLNLLTTSNIIEIAKADGFIHMEELLAILAKGKIPLDSDVLRHVCSMKADQIWSINRLLRVLLEARLLHKNNFFLLLTLESNQLSTLSFALTHAQETTKDLFRIDQNILNWMILISEGCKSSTDAFFLIEKLSKNANNVYYDFIRLLDINSLLTQSHLNTIRNYNVDKVKAASTFVQSITKNGLILNVTIANWVLSGNIDFENDDVLNKIIDAFDILLKHQLIDENIALLTQLRSNKLLQISLLIINLNHYNLLNHESFNEAYSSVIAKLPTPNPSIVTIKSKKQTGESRSCLSLSDGSQIYVENTQRNNSQKKTHEGAFGEVKRGYSESTNNQAVYAIKTPKNNNLFLQAGFNASPELQCKRELKYGRLLNRNVFYFFYKDKPRAVMDWLNGILLKDLNAEQAKKMPISDRLQCLISALKDLNALHTHYRSHNDIKSDNFILNIEDKTLRLIDFGISGRPTGERKNHYFFDIESMGHCILPLLFPEILSNRYEMEKCSENDSKEFECLQTAITLLHQSMIQEDPRSKCHCSDALRYCHEILDNSHQLSSELLDEIASRTIQRAAKNIDDVLHEYVPYENKRTTCLVM